MLLTCCLQPVTRAAISILLLSHWRRGCEFCETVAEADHSDELDQLLDSALDDFQNLNLSSSLQSGVVTDNEHSSPSLPYGVEGLGTGLPNLRSKKKGKQKVSQYAHISEAFHKLTEQTREAVKRLDFMCGSTPGGHDLNKDVMVEDWVKQFEDLAGSLDMESIVPTTIQQLLSKGILHEPMKEIGERYPKSLEDHKSSLSKGEYERYSYQYELIQNLNEVYENDAGNFKKIVEVMQKMQECG